ncbi:efflux transporter outer membrane subunit [Zwartia vadi]|uniref:efflux transporter outer membrane subunit n=1 Tax=Zwartia vadi TaxID=3058168 RepID=UPI0025B5ADAD|nr:efflux transporter outer membrane subunit [Zwartia vadi]MDN3986920.1 efflux transporter outer membrane subunit [Zwartia vadi]
MTHRKGSARQCITRFAGVCALTGMLSGCLLGPDYERPAVELPDAYRTPSQVASQSVAVTSVNQAPRSPSAEVMKEWWTLFNDPVLNDLIVSAQKNNADIQIAVARLGQAQALARQAGAALYPTVNLTASGTRASTGTSVNPSGVGFQTNTAQLGVVTSYEIDVWGRVRRNIESATAVATASQYEQDSVRLTLSALVANTYLRLRALDAQIDVVTNSVKTRENSLRVAQAKLDGGLVSPIDVSQARAAKAASEAGLSELTRQRAIVQNQLGILTGQLQLTLAPLDLRGLPIPPVPPAGLPSTLLERRPDVNRVEQELTAANARIGVATANFFPTLSLTALFGAQSVDFSAFLSGQSAVWSAGLGLLQPVFTGGSLRARLDFAKAQQQEVLGNYVKVVRNAFGEVSDALVSVNQTLQTEHYLTEQVAAATKAQELATVRYEAGYVDYLNVLEAQRVQNEANLAFVLNRALRLQAGVDLFKALGGGWNPPTP